MTEEQWGITTNRLSCRAAVRDWQNVLKARRIHDAFDRADKKLEAARAAEKRGGWITSGQLLADWFKSHHAANRQNYGLPIPKPRYIYNEDDTMRVFNAAWELKPFENAIPDYSVFYK